MEETQHSFGIPDIMKQAKEIEKTIEEIDNLRDKIDKLAKEKVEWEEALEMQGAAFGRYLNGWTPEEVLSLLNEISRKDLVKYSALFSACLSLPEGNQIREHVKETVHKNI